MSLSAHSKLVLVIGGYGNFGSIISRELAKCHSISLIIAGRSLEKAQRFAGSMTSANPVLATQLDIHINLEAVLAQYRPDIVIHTSGPYQGQPYHVAQACIAQGCHYIDLADAREFVAGISTLDASAKEKNVLLVSGASSVPCLSAAVVDYLLPQFLEIHELDYGISTAQKAGRGLATTKAILSYTGKAFTTIIQGKTQIIYGWQGLHRHKYRMLAAPRWLSYCNVPDIALFPTRYPSLKSIRFYAGLEVAVLHFGLWGLSWLVRAKIIRSLQMAARSMLKMSDLFDWLGTHTSIFHLRLSGLAKDNTSLTKSFELIAHHGDGLYIPCMPAILLAKKLATNQLAQRGAQPCIGLISLDDYMDSLQNLNIRWQIF
jgi:hypothetical protein